MLCFSGRTPQERIEAFYGTKIFDYIQKLSHFEVRNFGRISFKKTCISGKLELVSQSLLNQAQIFTSPSLYQDKKSVVKEL